MDSTKGASEPASNEPSYETLDPERALFEGRVQGVIALINSNDRPLKGLAGLLDWRFQGAISGYLARGILTGRSGECTYVPLRRGGTLYHLLLVGTDARGAVDAEAFKALKKNLTSLKLQRLGLSRADWHNTPAELYTKNLKGTGICLLR